MYSIPFFWTHASTSLCTLTFLSLQTRKPHFFRERCRDLRYIVYRSMMVLSFLTSNWSIGRQVDFMYLCPDSLLIVREESRVYNLSVYDEHGNTICSMQRLEARAFCASPPVTVQKRYEMIYQPVGIDTPIFPLNEALHVHDEETLALHQWLDKASQEVILQSLARNPQVGSEVCPESHTYFRSRLMYPSAAA